MMPHCKVEAQRGEVTRPSSLSPEVGRLGTTWSDLPGVLPHTVGGLEPQGVILSTAGQRVCRRWAQLVFKPRTSPDSLVLE